MSHSLHVVGFKPPDEKWRKMKAVWDACNSAGIDPPSSVEVFFNYETPANEGVRMELGGDHQIQPDPCCKEWKEESCRGFEIDVGRLPKDVKIVRFYVSY